MDDGFSPADHFDNLIKYWWIILFCMILGAGAGWLIHLLKAPIYEAKSTITTAINYVETGFMTDMEEDHALSTVGDVILSDAVINSLWESLDDENQASLGGDLREHLFAEREGYRWTLRVQAASSEVAAGVSAAWADTAMGSLNDSLDHARQALVLSRQISELQSCLEQSISSLPSTVPCEQADSADIQIRLSALSDSYKLEQSQSRGIIPAVVFSLTQQANGNGKPVTYQTAGLVLAGAMIGLIAGVILIIARIPQKLHKAPLRGK